ncbi:MAG TPA: TonB family protein [Terriglobales bacterium]|nr:TonB family protein [Terriglobales bacterium]
MRSTVVRIFTALVLLSSCLAFAETRKPAKNNRPVAYPETARQMHLSGTVKLDVLVTASGKVKKVEVLGGNPLLAAAAVQAVKDWTYEPASSDTTETVIVKFDQQ